MKIEALEHKEKRRLRRAVVLGGLGQVGTLLSQSLRTTGVQVLVADTRHSSGSSECDEYLCCDVQSPSRELLNALSATDALFVCLPETIALESLPGLLAALHKEAVWVDTLSVKKDIVNGLLASGICHQALSINPMFAPTLGWVGNAVAAVEVRGGRGADDVFELLLKWGARVERMGADEHDGITAAVQVATHAAILSFGAALLEMGYDVRRALPVATPPHKLLLTLLHRLTTQSAEVYWDIQAYHPAAATVRDQIAKGLSNLQQDIQNGNPDGFRHLLSDLKLMLADESGQFQGWAEQSFALLKNTPSNTQ